MIKGALEDIWYGNYVHTNINARDSRLKIYDRIKQAQSEWKEAELLQKRMRKYSHKVFKVIIKWVNHSLPVLG